MHACAYTHPSLESTSPKSTELSSTSLEENTRIAAIQLQPTRGLTCWLKWRSKQKAPWVTPPPYPLSVPFSISYVASYLLAALGGNSSPSTKDIKKILDCVGIEADNDRLNKVISELNGKNIEDVIAQGVSKLASVPAGGAVAVSAAPGSAAPAASSAPDAAEKKEEKKEESEESDDNMGFGLFD
ncbi:60S acidic ribosomal protein P2-like [Mesocricetus auratus]|uniref:Large ribosomal subunit protein P2 n=1 Tax=Mesocricetus auratus TaxID=10036 RepID=A0ABM2YBD8_MESAU|nr:60S acidic ribosomal protein P2-like [Mesocricetus auratus]